MSNEIPYDEFLKDIRRQKEEGKIQEQPKEPWELHREALDRGEYDSLTQHGRKRLDRPRPVWLPDRERWTVGAPVNPVEWQILIQSYPKFGRFGNIPSRGNVETVIMKTCSQFRINKYTFSESVSSLFDRHLLKSKGGFRRSKIADKWLFPDLTGPRAGGEWHRKYIHSYIDEVNRMFGCYTYADRGYDPGVEIPDVITVRPQLEDPWSWDMENPIYAEFKSARDMRRNLDRLEKQLDRCEGVPLYLEVEARVSEARDMIEERGRRDVDFLDLIKKAEGDMVYLTGSERPRGERSFETLLKKIKEAFLETYDRKARLKKTGTDPEGRECHDLILYDSLGTAKNVGQVIPDYAVDVEDFGALFSFKERLGRITTANYIYVPERKPTYKNKTWRWKKKETKGLKFRSFTP